MPTLHVLVYMPVLDSAMAPYPRAGDNKDRQTLNSFLLSIGHEIGCLFYDYHGLEHFNRMGVKVLDALNMFVRVSNMPDSLSCDQGQ